MSQGDRLSLAWATDAAGYLASKWGMHSLDCKVVGSVRRRRPEVGDIEFIAPLPHAVHDDPLWDAIDRTAESHDLFVSNEQPWVRPLKGLRRGFIYCSLEADLMHEPTGKHVTVAVQIHRYAADSSNRGWIELMRTGPGEFGRWFLSAWKQRRHISPERQASIDGHLVDHQGQRVATPTEHACFEAARLTYIPPEDRDGFIANVLRSQGLARREQMR